MTRHTTEKEYLDDLMQYSDILKVTRQNDMAVIYGKYGRIEPYSKECLQVWFHNPKTFHQGGTLSQKKLTQLMNKGKGLLTYTLVADGEGTAVFCRTLVNNVALFTGCKRRRRHTKEHIAKLLPSLKQNGVLK